MLSILTAVYSYSKIELRLFRYSDITSPNYSTQGLRMSPIHSSDNLLFMAFISCKSCIVLKKRCCILYFYMVI